MKILHIVQRYYPAWGGSERYVQIISEYLAKDNEVEVWTSDAYDLDTFWDISKKRIEKREERINNVLVKRFSSSPSILKYRIISKLFRFLYWRIFDFNLNIPLSFPFVLGMYRYAKTHKGFDFDIIQVTAAPYTILFHIASIVAKRCNAKLIVTPFIHLGESKQDADRAIYFKKPMVSIYKNADLIFKQTNAEKEAIKEFCLENGQTIEDSKFVKLGMGIFPDKTKGGVGERFRRKYKIYEPIVFSVGLRTKNKGSINLIEASKTLWDKGEKFKLIFAGMNACDFDDYFATVEQKYKERILIINNIEENDKLDLFDAGDIFSMVSKSDSFGIVYLESWFYKKPVIACDIPSIAEIVLDNTDGLLATFSDIEKIASNIEKLLKDKILAKRLGESGYTKVMKEFTWEKRLEIVKREYEGLVSI
ncbi:glycosyltransferase family 4 protein [Candidatus Dojkabacteria bacterium]|jgi:glycosyltransferase involved in cell wall biosynthesis|nr:glycosyltransferase family 4 protein [Candidatus Dojkabacteria bacterium]